jgi:hypothetical protein
LQITSCWYVCFKALQLVRAPLKLIAEAADRNQCLQHSSLQSRDLITMVLRDFDIYGRDAHVTTVIFSSLSSLPKNSMRWVDAHKMKKLLAPTFTLALLCRSSASLLFESGTNSSVPADVQAFHQYLDSLESEEYSTNTSRLVSSLCTSAETVSTVKLPTRLPSQH